MNQKWTPKFDQSMNPLQESAACAMGRHARAASPPARSAPARSGPAGTVPSTGCASTATPCSEEPSAKYRITHPLHVFIVFQCQ